LLKTKSDKIGIILCTTIDKGNILKPFVQNHRIIRVADVSVLVSGLYAFLGDFLLGFGVFSEVGKGFISELAIMIYSVIIVFISMFTVSCPNYKKL
jgi:hypothetical protein